MDDDQCGIFIDGLFVPTHAMYGIRNFGEYVWGPRATTKAHMLRLLREGSDEQRAFRETLYHRAKLRSGRVERP